MSAPIIHLEDYYLEKVLIERTRSEEEALVDAVTASFDFDYIVQRNADNSHQFALTFIVRDNAKAKTSHPQVYKFDLRLIGFFRFEENVEEEKMQWLIRYNGGTILYGILRGMITNMTAAFPEGPIRMPTIMMDEVVKKVEGLKGKPAKKKPVMKRPKGSN
jgi:preprotein translocase subunit SecB